jgi:hexosaminidase
VNLFAAALLILSPDSTGRLMPVPASVTWEPGRMRVDSTFTVRVMGQPKDARLDRGVARFVRRAERLTGLVMNQGGRGVNIRVQGPGQAVQSPSEDESYQLRVGRFGATLEAPTTVGALRGLETLMQLIDADSAGWFLPAVRIDDKPRFPWRGLLIDVSRHWQPPEVIKRQLDGMAAVKLNVFHWHLSEDQGFRVESRRFPRLQGMGSDGNFYTQEQIREIVTYARDRGIRVVPEFDVPGHSTSWFVGYPQYASGPGPYSIERRFGVFKPTFDPTREETYLFLDRFIGEMVTLFPDPYWHIGGDEVEGSQWRENPRIRAFMRLQKLADNHALQAYFNRRLLRILTRHGKRMIGWDEILHPDLPRTTIVQSWRGQQSLIEGAKQGYSGILSAGWYLDAMRTADFHYQVDPLGETALAPEESARILGGEACMWGEHLSIESIDSRIWPRLAAIAERLWSPPEVRDVADMYRRLDLMRPRLELAGLGSESHVARMARLLANGQDPAPLRQLLELVEPARFGERASLQKLTQQVPLVFVPDAARPEPPSHWAYRSLAMELFSANPGTARARFDSAFARWRKFPQDIERLAAQAPLAGDALPAARGLARVAAIGAEALQAPTGAGRAEWAAGRLVELDTLYRLQGLLRIAVIPAVKLLVQGSAP